MKRKRKDRCAYCLYCAKVQIFERKPKFYCSFFSDRVWPGYDACLAFVKTPI